MPNWCSNYLKVIGHPRRVVEFILENFNKCDVECYESFLSKDCYILTFENVVPTPKDKTGEITEDWYAWRLEHWGTKWDACIFSQSFTFKLKTGETVVMRDKQFDPKFFKETVDSIDVNEEASLEIAFNTAWTYPIGWYSKMFNNHEGDDLVFFYDYYEGGCGFAGERIVKNKDVLNDFHVECDDPIRYYKYILDKGHEDPEYIFENIHEIYHETYKHLGFDFVHKISESTENAIMNLKEHRNEALAKVYVKLLAL